MTSWVIGLRNSLLPMDLGLQLGGFSMCLLLPWMTSLRFAMDLEHPDLPAFLVKIVLKCLPDFGS
uniref:Zinc finger family protein n=1 Tax=Rhizophora mucronata TaxID=61149 RepID=A0A2P2QPN2_RHIMU